ncbi:hypothetical protein, partial [Nocardia abscessus]|uniref:hypothetical protein n=1 Tax=Nocardia abscessus TaxID=120957 RepID=UPI0024567F53
MRPDTAAHQPPGGRRTPRTPHDDATFTGSDFGLYTYAPYSDFIARYGCTRRDLESSLNALK